MADANIRHIKRGKHYRAPVMLNHRTMMRIGLGVILSMGLVFVSGYEVGLQKAESMLRAQTPGIEAVLPEAIISDSDQSEPNATLFNAAQASLPTILGRAIGGPAESDPAMIMDGDEESQVAIYDNASEETASYSIQVGMFGVLENAERKVEELIAVDLSAYLVGYMNKQSKMRYKVYFGYFADRGSATDALVIYRKELAGSGYVVPLQPSKDSISKTPV